MVLTICQCGKLFWVGDKIVTILFGFVILSGERCMGDNPLDTYSPLFTLTPNPTFYHRYGCYICEKTTFSPLTLAGGPVFYYIYFLAKKVILSIERGETNVVSVLTPLQGVRMVIMDHTR
jgi:hypothetical protein